MLVFIKNLFFELTFRIVLWHQAQSCSLATCLILNIISCRIHKFKFLWIHKSIGWAECRIDLSHKFFIKFTQTGTINCDCGLFHFLLSTFEDFSDFTQPNFLHLLSFVATWQARDEDSCDVFEGIIFKD
jgi:hypothetical protein